MATATQPKGLLSTAMQPDSVASYEPATATASKPTSVGYQADKLTVDPGTQTVQGQLAGITSKSSPLMLQAERRARESMVPRGTLNSSLAIGAAQDAVIGQALPIAQQDAQTYFGAATKNVDSENAARNFGANATNQANLAGAQLETDVSKSNAASTNEASARAAEAQNAASMGLMDVASRDRLAQLDSATRLQLQTMDSATRTNISNLENQYRQLLQASTNAASTYSQAVAAIGNISANPNLEQDAKDNAIQTQLNMLQEALAATQEITTKTPATITSLNLSQFFDGGINQELTPQQIADRRRPYEQAEASAKAAIPQWGVNQDIYIAPAGPNQSERTAANFRALYSQRYQEWQQQKAALDAFNAQYAQYLN